MRFSLQILCLLAVSSSEALSSRYTARSDPSTTTGSFSNPGIAVRPRFRYWLPDASIDPELLADDIAQIGSRGAGGIELLNYYNYGGAIGPAATDWNIYGYGTAAYRTVLKAALQACQDLGLLMDFSIGPQSGQGVPASPDNPGLAWELVSFNVTIPENGTYTGQVPGWGEGDLVSAVTLAILNDTTTVTVDPLLGTVSTSTEYLVSSTWVTEVTDSITPEGTVTVTASPVDGAEYYILYASYARRSYVRACIASSNDPQNILQNGSFAVDHFSETGARVSTSFLEEYILVDGIKELMMEAGNYIWEDSVEIQSYTYWTPHLPDIFEQDHGYPLGKYAFLLSGNEGDQAVANGPATFITDDADQGFPFVADYRSTMSRLLTTYLANLTAWSNEYLGLKFSQQVGYNLPVDMLEAIPTVDVPETETLSFSNIIDGFRQYCGPANLAGKPIISIELGAVLNQAYYQSWTDLLEEAKRSFVAGVNQLIIHGATYSHPYVNTTWPGFTSFDYLFSGQHSRHQPAWDLSYKPAVDYLARTQFVLQSGTAKVDLVFWDKQTAQNAYPTSLYDPADLVDTGYTYEYLSPENFALPNAYVEGGVFAPTQQAYQALVIRANDTLTPDGVRYLASYAASGLPIIISGGLPSTWATNNATEIQEAEAKLQGLLTLDNVHQVPYEGLAAVVSEIGIIPRAQVTSNGTWYTRWKEMSNGDVYVFIYNDGFNFSTGSIAFEASGTPYFLNAWTGEQTPVVEYLIDSRGRVVIPLALQSTETNFVRFSLSESASTLATRVTSSSGSVLGYAVDGNSGRVSAKVVASSGYSSLALASGASIRLPRTEPPQPSRSLTNWTVTVEQWLPPDDLYDIEMVANKTNITYAIAGPALPPWSGLGLQNVSGVGYYSSTLEWLPSAGNTTGAYLVVPPVAHGVVLEINGRELPPLDPTNPRLDVTPYLVHGANFVVLKAPTTLWNGLIPVWSSLRTAGLAPGTTVEELEAGGYGPQVYGIVGEVQLIPYELVQIS
ncbi:hypothetical protein BX600DRAFT_390073 [Xylariales sp. PMI_506]|nr:hypothetical protein BX600DRAFT_390073 [Xylariales sp. PMI_506]